MAASRNPPLSISNAQARRILIEAHGLARPPARRLDKASLQTLIEEMGFVQVDSINTLERAHHHILHSRASGYRPRQLSRLLERDRELFENWTHDASVIPSCFYPYWRHHFARQREALAARWRRWHQKNFEAYLTQVLRRIEAEGPLMARDFGQETKKANGGWWVWHPEKIALEYLWRTGALAVARREAFQKVYDLPERVIPESHFSARITKRDFLDWACRSALERLSFATPGEIAAFWGLLTPKEATQWCEAERNRLVEVEIEDAEGAKQRRALTLPAFAERLSSSNGIAPPPKRLRALSPFDPLLRDRKRCERIFGFHYRIEVFVPAAKRRYGYYVFPLLEGDRLIGRIDMKHERAEGRLEVKGLWLEPGIILTRGRRAALEAEIERQRRFTGAERTTYASGIWS